MSDNQQGPGPRSWTGEERRRAASIAEDSPFPIVELDAEMRLTYVNPAMVSIMNELGFTMEELAPAILPNDLHAVGAACLASGSRKEVEVSVQGRQWRWTFCPLPAKNLLRGYGMEVTEIHKAEALLRQRLREIERFNRLMVGRELRMIELKNKINDLSKELGRTPPYPNVADEK